MQILRVRTRSFLLNKSDSTYIGRATFMQRRRLRETNDVQKLCNCGNATQQRRLDSAMNTLLRRTACIYITERRFIDGEEGLDEVRARRAVLPHISVVLAGCFTLRIRETRKRPSHSLAATIESPIRVFFQWQTQLPRRRHRVFAPLVHA